MEKKAVLSWIPALLFIFLINGVDSAYSMIIGGQDIILPPQSVADDPPGAVNDHQQGFNEKQGVLLSTPLQVDGGAIPAGTVVNSHMIFLNTLQGTATDQDVMWRFDGPVLGVMSDRDGTLEAASSALLGAPGTTYPYAFTKRGLESNDYYTFSDNTIKVTMGVGEPGDWIRVVTKNMTSGVKWHQPPDMVHGVNIQSTSTPEGTPPRFERWVADDWQCRDPRPVSDVHFWGSYIGWRDRAEINASVAPPGVEAFIIRFFSDVPAGTNPDVPFSHPGELLYEARTGDFTETFVASIPILDEAGKIAAYEHKFAYDIDLTEPFSQEEGTVYWISITAVMPENAQFPWGWETSDRHWNDNACRFWVHNQYWDDINPADDFELPPWYPHQRVDMAFALTITETPPPPPPEMTKWQQRPDMVSGVNIKSDPQQRATVADDWQCLDGSPVTDLHFWGSYPGWQPEPGAPVRPPGVEAFRIQIFSDFPAPDINSFSRPNMLLYEVWMKKFRETYIGPIDLPWGEVEHKFRYDLDLPRIFWQKRGKVYWLNISAIPKAENPWGWESSMDRWNDVAVQGWYEDPLNWWWNILSSPHFTLGFEDLLAGDTYAVGDTFTTSGIQVAVMPFRRWDGTLFFDGTATVDNGGNAGGSGNEMNTNNVNLDFALPGPAREVSFLYGEYGGYNNISINGQKATFANYQDIDGGVIGGVTVSVTNGNGHDNGIVKLDGIVNKLAIGGQEHFIDALSFSRLLDMSFELSTCEGPIKWLQFPDMANGINIYSSPRTPIVADDFLCTNGKPITEIHFWGSFLGLEGGHWAQDMPIPSSDVPVPRVDRFKLSFHSDVPAGVDQEMPWSHPGELLKEVYISDFEQSYWDSIPHTDTAGRIWWEHKFYYIIKLRDEDQFRQRKGEIYWLDIGAIMAQGSNFHWGWETSKDHWNDAAVSGNGSQWNPMMRPGVADFEDLPSAAQYNVNDTFTTEEVSVKVEPFRYSDGSLDYNGHASVATQGCAGGSGQEIQLSVVNLAFEFPCEPHEIQMYAGHRGGLLNLNINGRDKTFGSFSDINGQIIEGALFLFDDPDGDGKGTLYVRGTILSLSLGGQELCIDDISYSCKPIDMAFALVTEDLTPYCEGDFDRDGDVDGSDLGTFVLDFNRTNCFDSGDCEGDFDHDGDVDTNDLMLFLPDFGRQDCPCALPEECDDGDPCTDDFFDQVTMQCTHMERSCSDGNLCTQDMCSPDTGECVHTPINCSDSDPCTQDLCDPPTGCLFPPVDCDDGIECTADICDAASGECVHMPDHQLCDDNDPCTIDRCDPPGGCFHSQICEACCLPDEICSDMPRAQCAEQGGMAMGTGSDCSNTSCAVTVEHDEFPLSGNELVLYLPSTGPEIIYPTGSMALNVYFEGPAEGNALDNDGDTLDEVKTKVVSLALYYTHPYLGTISLKLNPDFDSAGEMKETANLLSGRLDVPPFGPEGSTADSFFDIFFEIEVTGQKRHTEAPLRFASLITYKPRGENDKYLCITPEPVDLFNEAGYPTGETLGCVLKGACCISGRCQELTPAECEIREGTYMGNGTVCIPELCQD